MVENPSVEIARPLRTDVSGAQFRGLVNLALAEGLRSAIARPTSLRAFQRELAPLSIALIVQGQHRHRKELGIADLIMRPRRVDGYFAQFYGHGVPSI
jgi:hypothetical protein